MPQNHKDFLVCEIGFIMPYKQCTELKQRIEIVITLSMA